MTATKYCFIIFSFFVFIAGTVAQPAGFESLKDIPGFRSDMKQAISNVQTISSKFTQEKNLDVFQETILSEGVFYYQRTDKVRWEYLEPISYSIIMNGDDVMIKSDDKVSVFDMNENAFIRQINEVMIGSVQGEILDKDDMFSVEYYKGNAHYLAVLTPITEEVRDILKKVEIYFDQKDFSADKLIFTEYTGDYTRIVFYDKVFNEAVPEDIFHIN